MQNPQTCTLSIYLISCHNNCIACVCVCVFDLHFQVFRPQYDPSKGKETGLEKEYTKVTTISAFFVFNCVCGNMPWVLALRI